MTRLAASWLTEGGPPLGVGDGTVDAVLGRAQTRRNLPDRVLVEEVLDHVQRSAPLSEDDVVAHLCLTRAILPTGTFYPFLCMGAPHRRGLRAQQELLDW